jgi:hypothetical protein
VELQYGEDLGIGLEADRGALALGLPHHRELLGRLAPDKLHMVPLAVPVHDDLQPLAQRIDHRDADAVESAGDLVAVFVELAPGVQHREGDLDCRLLLRGMHVHRNATAVVGHRNRVVGVDGDVDGVTMARECLVDRVVDNLVYQVVEPILAGGADIHARAFAYRLQTLEDLNRFRFVLQSAVDDGVRFFGHVSCLLRHLVLANRYSRSTHAVTSGPRGPEPTGSPSLVPSGLRSAEPGFWGTSGSAR